MPADGVRKKIYTFDAIACEIGRQLNYQLTLDQIAAISVWLLTLPSFAANVYVRRS